MSLRRYHTGSHHSQITGFSVAHRHGCSLGVSYSSCAKEVLRRPVWRHLGKPGEGLAYFSLTLRFFRASLGVSGLPQGSQGFPRGLRGGCRRTMQGRQSRHVYRSSLADLMHLLRLPLYLSYRLLISECEYTYKHICTSLSLSICLVTSSSPTT